MVIDALRAAEASVREAYETVDAFLACEDSEAKVAVLQAIDDSAVHLQEAFRLAVTQLDR